MKIILFFLLYIFEGNDTFMKFNDLFDCECLLLKDFFDKYNYPFECLEDIGSFIIEIGKKLPSDKYDCLGNNIWIDKSVEVSKHAILNGPLIVMEDTCIRPNAYIRGNVFIGRNSVIGNSTELKNCILLDNVQVPHFNYVGDSILGNNVHLGAGVIVSNLRSDKRNVKVEDIDTGIRKVGAFIGDKVEVGCNSVICPGTVIGKNTVIYPLVMVKGVIEKDKIIKKNNEVVNKYFC